MTEIVVVKGEGFKGVVRADGAEFRVELEGTADYAALAALEMIADRTHGEAVRLDARRVVVDLRRVEFMSSSCFKAVVGWIARIQDLPANDRYQVEFVAAAAHRWQRRSLHALQCFAEELVSVTER